jgi:aminoglycoside phosphotransferase (APT) family kinase protein
VHETSDPAAVVGALSPGARVISAEPLRGGVSAAVFAVSFAPPDGAPERVVVRQHRSVAGKDGTPGERAAREFAVLQALHARGVAVPAPRLFIPPATMVIAFVDGTSELPPDAAGALARTLADIHRLPRKGLPALPTFDDPMPSLHAWFPQLHAHPVLQAGCGAFAGDACLVHGDFWPGNVFWQVNQVAAVLDWEDALLGDPLIDVACMRSELFRVRDAQAANRFTEAYRQLLPVDDARLAWWDLFMAAAPLQYMDGWGLADGELAARKAASTAWQARALATLGLDA